MNIEKKPRYFRSLIAILAFIAKDKISAAKTFEKELDQHILDLIQFPYKYRQSDYYDDQLYRDLTYKGYTVIYKITDEVIQILDIFKWTKKK